MLLMWYTYLFDALLSRQLGTGTTADAIGLSLNAQTVAFPYACANDMFHVEDSVSTVCCPSQIRRRTGYAIGQELYSLSRGRLL